jgi:hypothetical protein
MTTNKVSVSDFNNKVRRINRLLGGMNESQNTVAVNVAFVAELFGAVCGNGLGAG